MAPEGLITGDQSDATPVVKAFLERATRLGSAKSGASLSMDSAEWYVEAALNYSFAEAWISTEEIRRDTLRFELPCEQDLVSSDALYAAYLNTATVLPTGWNEESEHLILADVQAGNIDGSPILEVVYMIGTREGSKSLNTYFGPNQHYRAMWELVYPTNCGCGPNNGGNGPCAAKQIQGRLNTALPPLGVGQYFTNIEVCYMGGPGFFWYCQDNCYDVCLGPSELSALVTSGWTAFNLCQPPTKAKIKSEVFSYSPLCCTWAQHDAIFHYGIKQSGASS